jgi:hypothetical protein
VSLKAVRFSYYQAIFQDKIRVSITYVSHSEIKSRLKKAFRRLDILLAFAIIVG